MDKYYAVSVLSIALLDTHPPELHISFMQIYAYRVPSSNTDNIKIRPYPKVAKTAQQLGSHFVIPSNTFECFLCCCPYLSVSLAWQQATKAQFSNLCGTVHNFPGLSVFRPYPKVATKALRSVFHVCPENHDVQSSRCLLKKYFSQPCLLKNINFRNHAC